MHQAQEDWKLLFAMIVNEGRKIGIVALLAVLLTVIMSTHTLAAPMFRSTGNNGKPVSLTLNEEPCTHPKIAPLIAERVKPEYAQGWRRAVLNWDGKDWESCWKALGGAVYSIDEEGVPFQPVPMGAFREGVI